MSDNQPQTPAPVTPPPAPALAPQPPVLFDSAHLIQVVNYATLTFQGRTLRCSSIQAPRKGRLSDAFPEGPDGAPGTHAYQPIQFPKGIWQVMEVHKTDHPLMSPYFIGTNAHQTVTCFDGTLFDDWGYGIHYDAQYEDTWGCIHLYSADEATWLAQAILSLGGNIGVQVA
jgi:hypothetical protein